MSQSHVRVPPPPLKRNYWIEAPIVLACVVLAGLLVHSRLWPDPVENTHETATGKVLETHLVVVGTTQSRYGGGILYRIEAHVTYLLHGMKQDRWMPASGESSDRVYLALQMMKSTCVVYWSQGHDENPRCLLK